MTKKAERAARIAADKRAAWMKKVRTLTGHMIYDRAPAPELDAAYTTGKTADAFAAELAGREPVGKAVHPLKVEAVKRAAGNAEAQIENVRKALEAVGWDLNIAAPYPRGNESRADYKLKESRYHRFSRLTKTVEGARSRHGMNDPHIVEMDPKARARFIQNFEEAAAFQYDSFICKLVMKVGECTAAAIQGSHVWGESILTVQKGFGVERWRTHQIENVSKLGLYFPQWPTRLMKGA